MIDRLYMHCSGSSWGNENAVCRWHMARGFRGTGYNYVVNNGFPFNKNDQYEFLDGSIETARPDWTTAAAVKGDNRNTAHVCLIGMPGKFTPAQIKAAMLISRYYMRQGLAIRNIMGHYEYWTRRGKGPLKTCPGINMDKFRNDLLGFIENGRVKAQTPIKIAAKPGLLGGDRG